MNIAISGGTGFVGKKLTQYLISEDHKVFILTRNPDDKVNTEQVTYVGWLKDGMEPEKELPPLDAIINLAGHSLSSGRWNQETKERILTSRLEATDGVLNIIEKTNTKPQVLINASAVGYYGTSETKTFTENTTAPGDDFLAYVVNEWEKRGQKAEDLGVRSVFLRFGVILGDGGALPQMMMPYKFFVGGNVGNGEQWMSWIHIDDVVGIIRFAITNKEARGPINATAPNPKQNKDFGKTLAKVLNKPHFIPAPSFVLKLLFGEMSMLLLKGQYVLPQKAQELNYSFQYPELEPALRDILIKDE